MLDRAINGEEIETSFDESKASQIESKLHKYLVQTGTSKKNIAQQKLRVDELISDISHQTKTPLANIMLYSELICESESSEKTQKYSDLLKAQTEKLNFLITSLVKTSRLENGIIAAVPKAQSINLLLENAQKTYPNLKINYSDIILNYDLKWTTEAILNIIDNAVKYGSTNTEITVTAYGMFAKIDISDNAMGIEHDEIPKIFARFYRSKSACEKEGVGLGLYLAREIISKQGGYIKVKSKVNKGSVFSVFLPRQSE